MPKLSGKNLPKRIKRLAKGELRHLWRMTPIANRTVLYESFSGNGMLCQPEALFRELLADPKYSDLQHIWVLNDFERYASTIEEFRNHKNVKFVKYLSHSYYRALITSKFLINNVSFPTQFSKRSEQVYLNTWHGIPLKKMGYDIPGRAVDAKNIIRNFLNSDYLLSSSPAMTEEMYMNAFKLKNIYEGKIIEEGNPRIDRQRDAAKSRQEFNDRFKEGGGEIDDRKIILYAPTWKGESYFNPHNDGASLKNLIESIEANVDTSKYRIMVKAHQVVSGAVGKIGQLKNYLVPNSIPTNVVLGASDLLITDYSSIFFDFLARDKPIVFYIPDLDDYKRYRDLYMKPEELPGLIARSSSDLTAILSDLTSVKNTQDIFSVERERMRQKYLPSDDGNASSRIIEVLFGKDNGSKRVVDTRRDGKKKILIYGGGMIPNGITTSAINLLDNIDYGKYDVTVLCPFGTSPEQMHSYSQINPKARIMFRFGTFNGGYVSNSLRLAVLRKGAGHWASGLKSQHALWSEEWIRCFGSARFDHMIDFSGYTSFWGTLFLHGPAEKRSIWLHNDLAADAHRSIEGNKPLKEGLFSTFSIYHKFDYLVSVSEGLSEINRRSLEKWAPNVKFRSASNTLNADKIVAMSNEVLGGPLSPQDEEEVSPKRRSYMMGKLVSELINPDLALQSNLTPDLNNIADPEYYFTFVSAGRLSPEKNHSRLIQAFSIVHESIPATRLVIAGEGPLRNQLEQEVEELGLTESVKLVGHTKNPYALMRLADSFVLSSDYEGQPMVLLEALVLGLSVITTSFGSVAGALPPNVGAIVPATVDDLAAAMLNEAKEPTKMIEFDVGIYNKRAIHEFERILED